MRGKLERHLESCSIHLLVFYKIPNMIASMPPNVFLRALIKIWKTSRPSMRNPVGFLLPARLQRSILPADSDAHLVSHMGRSHYFGHWVASRLRRPTCYLYTTRTRRRSRRRFANRTRAPSYSESLKLLWCVENM